MADADSGRHFVGTRLRTVARPSSKALRAGGGDPTRNLVRRSVERLRFFNLEVYALADPQIAVAEVKGEGLIKSTGRMYRQDYVVFLRAADGKIRFLREYFDPVRAAKALDTPILGLES